MPFCCCALVFVVVRVVVALCTCVFLLPPLLWFWILIILCKAWETSTCGDSSQMGWHIRKNIVALKFNLWITWDRLIATLDRRRSPQCGVGFGQTMGKSSCLLSTLLYCDFCLPYCLKLRLHNCWGPSSSEGPQKHDLTMFPECNIWIGSFGLGSEPHSVKSTNNTKVDAASKLHARELRHNGKKGNRLKREKVI
jgi:hypothetical protein